MLRTLARRVGFGLQFVSKLIELVEVDSGPEAESVRNGLRRGAPARRRLLAKPGAQRSVDDILEWHSKLSRAPLQEAGQVVVDGERGAHAKNHGCGRK